MIESFREIFGNREIAAWIWTLIIIIFVLVRFKMFGSFRDLLKAFFVKAILKTIFLMLCYISLIILVLFKLNLWDSSLIKDSIYWTGGFAFLLLMNSNKANEDDRFFKKKILDTLKFIIVFEFIVNLYSFSLIWELVIFPVLLFFTLMQVFADKPEHIQVKKVAGFILGFFGFSYFAFAIYHIIIDFENFATIDNLKSFFFVPVMSILYLPFIYLMALFMRYETYFTQIGFRMENKKNIFRYAKYRIIKLCWLNLRKLNHFTRNTPMYKFDTIDEIKSTINDYKKMKINESPVANKSYM